jgi:hypothetical protein
LSFFQITLNGSRTFMSATGSNTTPLGQCQRVDSVSHAIQLSVERNGSGDRCTMGFPTTGGSINEVGWRFQPFRINDLEMVDQTGIEPVTS